jgi:exosortase E/protease (VPEID-CTERM system)
MVADHPSPSAVLRLPSPLWTALAALLAAEAVGLTLRFSVGTATDPLPVWLLRMSKLGFQLLVGAASVVLLLTAGDVGVRTDVDRDSPTAKASHRPWPFLVAHFTALAGFAWLTAIVLEGGARPLPAAIGLGLAWASLGLATMVTWIGIGLSPDRCLGLLRRGPGLLLVGGAAGLATWGTGLIAKSLWHPLGRSTLWVVHQLLRPFVEPLIYRPDTFQIGTPGFLVWIAPGCSGYEGMGLVFLLAGSYLWVARRRLRFPRAMILLPMGLAVIWLANTVRLAALVALGSWGYGAVAMDGFHSQAGWLALDAVGLGLVLVASRWSYLRVDVPRDGGKAEEPSWPTAAYLAPLLALVVAQMIAGAFSAGGVDRLYPLRIAAATGVLWSYRRLYAQIRWTPSWQAVGLGVAAFALWMALEPLAPARSPGPAGPTSSPEPGWAWGWLVVRVVGSVVIVPLAEELAFRAYLTRRLIATRYWVLPMGTFTGLSFVISSGLFGLLHGRWLAGTLAGLLYALALYRRRELSDAVLAHATTNAMIAAVVLASGDRSLWA